MQPRTGKLQITAEPCRQAGQSRANNTAKSLDSGEVVRGGVGAPRNRRNKPMHSEGGEASLLVQLGELPTEP